MSSFQGIENSFWISWGKEKCASEKLLEPQVNKSAFAIVVLDPIYLNMGAQQA